MLKSCGQFAMKPIALENWHDGFVFRVWKKRVPKNGKQIWDIEYQMLQADTGFN